MRGTLSLDQSPRLQRLQAVGEERTAVVLLAGHIVRLPFKYSCLCPLLAKVSIAEIKDHVLKAPGEGRVYLGLPSARHTPPRRP